ncbi:hypothetical protein RHMOL_Rhmol04G0013100 [Rhododendron molle]|uniref:Uncharacterized protein n=1 Tax=Rhododendron molle TaxID=49168 RepID=A0ACC0NX52_RHOML|nr:hypothetical protein RHMOL_Rhmol04G0013100 [Rhododendron molle]
MQANNRALDILFGAVDVIEHRKLANCEIAKEAWDILVTCHEGTYVVKQSKLQRLTIEFKMIRMEEEETFNQFYSKLISIVNNCKTLECHGYGHLAHECINVLKRKTNFKANITWDDSLSDSSEVEQEDKANFTSFVASLHSQTDDKSINKFDQRSSDDSENEDGGEFDDEDDLRESYDRLYRESVRINKVNLTLTGSVKMSMWSC